MNTENIIKTAMLESGEIQASCFKNYKIDLQEVPLNVINLINKCIRMNNILDLEISLKGFNLNKKMFDSCFVTFKNKENGIFANVTNEKHEFPNSVICFIDTEKEMIKKIYMAVK